MPTFSLVGPHLDVSMRLWTFFIVLHQPKLQTSRFTAWVRNNGCKVKLPHPIRPCWRCPRQFWSRPGYSPSTYKWKYVETQTIVRRPSLNVKPSQNRHRQSSSGSSKPVLATPQLSLTWFRKVDFFWPGQEPENLTTTKVSPTPNPSWYP